MQRLALIGGLAVLLLACTKKNDTGSTKQPEGSDGTPTGDASAGGDEGGGGDEELSDADERKKQIAACDKGQADECTSAAILFQQDGGEKELAEARVYFEKGCSGGHDMGCSYLASMLAQGQGGDVDAAKARELWDKQCDKGNNLDGECMSAALSYAESKDDADKAKARERYQKMCSKGEQAACVGEARVVLDIGNPKDRKHAASVLKKACDDGDGESCHHLAHAMTYGLGVPKDLKGAVEMKKKACANGYKKSCPE
jgi:TPR repeat protein